MVKGHENWQRTSKHLADAPAPQASHRLAQKKKFFRTLAKRRKSVLWSSWSNLSMRASTRPGFVSDRILEP